MEINNQDEYLSRVMQWMGYEYHFTVPPLDLSGGLALFWKQDIMLDIIASSPNFIDAKLVIKYKLSYLTLFYGNPIKKLRKSFWNTISEMG